MAITSAQVTVGAAAVALSAAESDVVSGAVLICHNTDEANGAALGPAAVTAEDGYRLNAGESVTVPLQSGDRLYAIRTDAADVVIDVLRIGV